MKNVLLIVFFYLACLQCFAQFKRPFGKISGAEIDMKECSFDKDAEAVILVDEAYADHNDDYNLIVHHHKRIKILKEKGIKYADISIRYTSENDFESIDNISAEVINIDEKGQLKEVAVERKNIYHKNLTKYSSEVTFAFPQVKVGSIIEYSYTSTKKNFGGLKDWEFQDRLPVCFSAFELRPAPNLEFTYSVQKDPKFVVAITPSKSLGTIYFEMNNVPSLGEEPYMDSRDDYIQKVRFQITKYVGMTGLQRYMSSWNEVAGEFLSDREFGVQIKANLREAEDLILPAVSNLDDLKKMTYIHNFVRNNIAWNYVGTFFAEETAKTTWSKKSGSTGSNNLLLINILKSAGLDAYPMLVSERGNGKIDKTTPFLNQFNRVYAAVNIKGKYYYLNAIDKSTPSHLIPYSILNTSGLIIKGSRNAEIVDISEENTRHRENIMITGKLSSEGQFSSHVEIASIGYGRAEALAEYNSDKKNYIENSLKHNLANVNIDSFIITNHENDTLPLFRAFRLSTHIQTTGDYGFLNMNYFTGLSSNPFIISDRFSNVNFGYKKTINLSYAIDLPENFTVDVIPENIRMVNEDRSASFTREIFYTPGSGKINARLKIELNKSLFNTREYPALKEFFKKMIDLMNEQVVVKNK
jgi:hypothetical protein